MRMSIGLALLLCTALPMQAALALQAQPAATCSASADPASVARTVDAIAKIRFAYGPSFSPDGKSIAYISSASGIPQVWTMPVAGGEPRQVTNLSDPVQSVHWSPSGDWLAYDVAPGGGLNVQIYVARPDGSDAKRLTVGGEDNNQLAGWTDDGKWLRIGSNAAFPEGFDAILLDPVSGEKRAVVEKKSLNLISDVSADGKRAVVGRTATRDDNNAYLVDLASGRETLITPHEGKGEQAWGEFSADGRSVYVISNNGRDMMAFGTIALDAAGKPAPIRYFAERDDAEAQSALLTRDGSRAALVWNAAGRSELAFLDTASGKVTPGPKLPVDIISDMDFSRDGKTLAINGSAANRPNDVYLIDVPSGRVTQATKSAHDGVDLATFVRPELVSYKAHDGLDLSGWLYRSPCVTGAGPLVFVYHGGPEGQARPSLSGDIQALAARGISVFAPNVRGSSGFGKRFMALDNGARRVDGVRDIKASTDAMIARGVADPKRLGIMGGSYGGYMVMAGVTEYPDMFAVGANLFGVVNFDTFFKNTQPWMAAISTDEYGNPATEAEMLKSLSPIHKLDRITTPLIVLHGANDTNVPLIEAKQIVESLRARNVAVNYVEFPDEGHGWRKLPNRVKSTTEIVGFFEQHLK
ncbi:S9 family peptidase [Allosphingosinicella indica]|uniref:Dipeptidyl aminopeptidase/acylaminoacyl peptidase n=1 Tax=Allosphingosinicella indica TaxID=941907 RepID=A0A1X7GZ61_9SPHN|nr:S9 family peptidase [Allosphingosinicella indica]SMF76215.1 Dipeptidyl aminopeptidase/acylaminoacyl peptidase [Allosphingosinicella indica]